MRISKILAFLTALATTLCASAQSGHDLQDDGLHGSVKRIDAVLYEARYNLNDNHHHFIQ